MSKRHRRILSIHWGFIPGGGAAYARHIEDVGLYAPVSINSICINSSNWPFDAANASYMNMDIIEIRGRADFSWRKKVRAIVEKELPDLILVHGFNGAFVGAVAGCGLSVPVVSSWHGDYFPSTTAQRLRRPFFDFLLKVLFRWLVKEIVTVSNYSQEVLVKKGIDPGKITVIHNGIQPEPASADSRMAIREELHVPDGRVVIGTACRLVAPKGLDHFIKAVSLVSRKVRDIHCVIWGDGPQRNSLRRLADELGIGEFLSLPGHRNDIARCLSALDIYCMSSHAENFSIALLEAMRAGLPIVATNVGGNPEAIRAGEEGILVPAADPQALADAILTLMNDPSKRERMAFQARQRFLAEFTSERMVARTASWFITCLHKHGRST